VSIAKNLGDMQARTKITSAFSKFKSCNGKTTHKEQKMFTSQKCFLCLGTSAVPMAMAGLNISYTILNESLPTGNGDQVLDTKASGAQP
jgi:hypothetical protein